MKAADLSAEDDRADLEATIQAVEEFALTLPKKDQHILRRILRVRPAARAVLPELSDYWSTVQVRMALERLQRFVHDERKG